MSKRTSLKLTDERQRKLDRAKELLARDEHDDPPMSVVFDAALDHLLESHDNVADIRRDGEMESLDFETVRRVYNTSVLKAKFRSELHQTYRR